MLSQKTSDKNGWKKSGHAASEEFDVPWSLTIFVDSLFITYILITKAP
jgi:hypothetical protein